MSFKINVLSQTRKRRTLVGELWFEKGAYCFQYNLKYARMRTAIPLGNEFPLTRAHQIFKQKKMFESFLERLPSKQNPEYANYCKIWDIPPEENDPMLLLVTVGNRGPSSFLFRKAPQDQFDGAALKKFRTALGLTLRDLADFLDVQEPTLVMTEKGRLKSEQLLKMCELLAKIPQALKFKLKQRGQFLHDEKIKNIETYLANTKI
jgi:DNA-binding XRE family transcriptional regulator